MPAGCLRRIVKRPYLHAGDTHVQQADGQFIRVLEKAPQVFIWPLRVLARTAAGQVEARRALLDLIADILIAGAGIIDPDLIPAGTAQ